MINKSQLKPKQNKNIYKINFIFIIIIYYFFLSLTLKLECPMKLQKFPLDNQTCTINIGSCKIFYFYNIYFY